MMLLLQNYHDMLILQALIPITVFIAIFNLLNNFIMNVSQLMKFLTPTIWSGMIMPILDYHLFLKV